MELLKLSIKARIEDFDNFFKYNFYDDRIFFFEKQKYRLRKLLFEAESHDLEEENGKEVEIKFITDCPTIEKQESQVVNKAPPSASRAQQSNINGVRPAGRAKTPERSNIEAPKSAKIGAMTTSTIQAPIESQLIYSVAMNPEDYKDFVEFKRIQERQVPKPSIKQSELKSTPKTPTLSFAKEKEVPKISQIQTTQKKTPALTSTPLKLKR